MANKNKLKQLIPFITTKIANNADILQLTAELQNKYCLPDSALKAKLLEKIALLDANLLKDYQQGKESAQQKFNRLFSAEQHNERVIKANFDILVNNLKEVDRLEVLKQLAQMTYAREMGKWRYVNFGGIVDNAETLAIKTEITDLINRQHRIETRCKQIVDMLLIHYEQTDPIHDQNGVTHYLASGKLIIDKDDLTSLDKLKNSSNTAEINFVADYNTEYTAVIKSARELIFAAERDKAAAAEQANLQRISEADLLKLNAGIAKRYQQYAGAKLYPLPDPRAQSIKTHLEHGKAKINHLANPLYKNELIKLAELMVEEILAVEQQRQAQIHQAIAAHNQKFAELVQKYKFQQWPTGSMFGHGSSYKLAYDDLSQPKDFAIEAQELRHQFFANLKLINNQDNYTANQCYAEHLPLLAASRFGGIDLKQAAQILTGFKEKVDNYYTKELTIANELHKLQLIQQNSEHKLSLLKPHYNELQVKLKKLQQKALDKEPYNVDAAIQARADVKNIVLEVDNTKDEIEKYAATLQGIILEQRQLQRQRGQWAAQVELTKREALGLVPPLLKNFIKDQQSKSLIKFKMAIDQLANSADQSQREQLYNYGYEIITNLPALGLPDLTNNGRFSYSQTNIDNIMRAFMVIAAAQLAAKHELSAEPDDPRKRERCAAFEQVLQQLTETILVQPNEFTVIGFELLAPAEQQNFLTQIAASSDINTVEQQQLKRKILMEVDKIKHAQAQKILDKQLSQNKQFKDRLDLPENLALKNALINNQTVIIELQMMVDRLNNYLASNEFAGKEYLRQQKEDELERIKSELWQMQKNANSDYQKIYDLLKIGADTRSYFTSVKEGSIYYATQLGYLGGGYLVGHYLYEISDVIKDQLTKHEVSVMLSMAAKAPVTSASVGAIVGNNAAYQENKYSDANISYLLPSAVYAEVLRHKAELKSGSRSAYDLFWKKYADVKANYIDAYKKTKETYVASYLGSIKQYKRAFIISLIGFLAVGVVVAASALLFGAPLIIAGLAALGAGVLGAVTGAVKFSAIGAKIYNYNENANIRDNALAKVAASTQQLPRPDQFNKIPQDDPICDLVNKLNLHFSEQKQLIHKRLKSYDPSKIFTPEQEQQFEDQIIREMKALEAMQVVQQQITENLMAVDQALGTNQELAQAALKKLKAMIANYLDDSYNEYHKPHIVDKTVELRTAQREQFIINAKLKAEARAKQMAQMSRADYLAAQDATEPAAQQQVGNANQYLADETRQIGLMLQVKEVLDKVKK